MRLGRAKVSVGVILTALWGDAAQAQVANDPFQSVPAPPPRSASRLAQDPAATVGRSFRDCAECPEMVVIPAGSFVMGSPASEQGRRNDEGPQRGVAVRAPLAVGKYAVTFAEWDACVAAGGCSYRPRDEGWGRGRQPVINVSWNDAQQYVRWLRGRTRGSYRLLTEAEWEYAARARAMTPYSFGRTIRPGQANFGRNAGRTQPVGSYPANRWGLHDMHGNVWEWVQDCYGSYAGAPADARQTVESGSCSSRVLRGGSWNDVPRLLRSANRYRGIPGYRYFFLGFRVARTPVG